MKRSTYILFLILILTSCNKKKKFINNSKASIKINYESNPIKLNLTKNIRTDFYSQIDSIQLIKLKMTDETVIGKISCLYIVNDTLFVVDYYKAKSIFAFDMNGNFLYRINKIGNGPGEYQSLNAVQISEKSISILDWFTWKLIRYDLKGHLISEQKLDKCPSDFIEVGQEELIVAYTKYTAETPFRIELRSLKDSTKETAFPITNNRDLTLSGGLSIFQRTRNNKILFRLPLNDTIFQIDGKQIRPIYNLNLNKPDRLVSFFNKNLKDVDFLNKIRKSEIADIPFFAELDNWIYVSYFKEGLGYVSIISKQNHLSKNFIVADVVKRKVKDISFFVSGYYKNTMLTSIDETFFTLFGKKDQERLYSHLKNKQDIDLIKELKNTNNNPVVCLFHLKSHKCCEK